MRRASRKILSFLLIVMLGVNLFLLSTSSSSSSLSPTTTVVLQNAITILTAGNKWLDTAQEGQKVNEYIHSSTATAVPSSSAIFSSMPSSSIYRPWPKLVFQCGWHADLLSSLVFPNVPHQEYYGLVSLEQLQQQANNQTSNNTNNTTQTAQEEIDVPLVVGMHGPCKLNGPKNATTTTNTKRMRVHVQQHFPGKAIFFNGESFGDARGRNTYQVGAIAKNMLDPFKQNRSLNDFYYMSVAFLEVASTSQQREFLFNHIKKPKNTGKYNGVIYMASNCVTYRQEAADRISDVDPENLIVYYGGKCHGLRKGQQQEGTLSSNSSKLLPVPPNTVVTERLQFKENSNIYSQFRYCLVMENTAKSGYITEKIVFAFLGGCVPIYYGTTEVFDIFNKNAFVFYDIKNPEPALEQIRYMEKENRTAYDDMLAQPILVNGTETIERYFSLKDDIGDGKLIRKIRAMLGYDPNNPFLVDTV